MSRTIKRITASRYPMLNKAFTKNYYKFLLRGQRLLTGGRKHELQLRLLRFVRAAYLAAITAERTAHFEVFYFLGSQIPSDTLQEISTFLLGPVDEKLFLTSFALLFGSRGAKMHYDAILKGASGEWDTEPRHVVVVDRGIYPDDEDLSKIGAKVAFLEIKGDGVISGLRRLDASDVVFKKCQCEVPFHFEQWDKLESHCSLGHYLCHVEDQQMMANERAAFLMVERAMIQKALG